MITSPEKSTDIRLPVRERSAASVHMDAIRGLAALSVLAAHYSTFFLWLLISETDCRKHTLLKYLRTVLSLPVHYAHYAVLVFFVLSGYLISSSVARSFSTNSFSWSRYLIQRLTRLYTVLIPALIACAIIDMVGRHMFGNWQCATENLYHVQWWNLHTDWQHLITFTKFHDGSPKTFVMNIFFLEGILCTTFGIDSPLWSLSYEFWYYLLFPLLLLISYDIRKASKVLYVVLVLMILLFVGKPISVYFLVWLMGYFVYRARGIKCDSRLATAVAIVSIIVGSGALGWTGATISDFVYSFCFSVILFCILRTTSSTPGCLLPRWYVAVSKQFADLSYSLYLLHFPFLLAALRFVSLPSHHWSEPFMKFVVLSIPFFAVCYVWLIWSVTEKKTPEVRRFFEQLLLRSSQAQLVEINTPTESTAKSASYELRIRP